MKTFPIIRILTTTAVAWMLADGVHAQSPAGGSHAEAEAIAAVPARSEAKGYIPN